jgi:hypothetical protein
MPDTARIELNVFDGTRRLLPGGTRLLVTLRDGFQHVAPRFPPHIFDRL